MDDDVDAPSELLRDTLNTQDLARLVYFDSLLARATVARAFDQCSTPAPPIAAIPPLVDIAASSLPAHCESANTRNSWSAVEPSDEPRYSKAHRAQRLSLLTLARVDPDI